LGKFFTPQAAAASRSRIKQTYLKAVESVIMKNGRMLSKNEVKYIRSLHLKKGRDASGCFIAEGPKLVNHLLKYHPEQLNMLLATEAYSIPSEFQIDENKFRRIGSSQLESISTLQHPQEVLALFQQRPASKPDTFKTGWILALDGIRDPGNMGTLFRIADWFGVKAVVCSDDCVDQYNPKVVQASMGSILKIPVVDGDLTSFLQETTLPVYGAVLGGSSLSGFAGKEGGVLVIGNEAEGIRSGILPFINNQVSIPSFGTAESLNAAVAAGIILWEIHRGE